MTKNITINGKSFEDIRTAATKKNRSAWDRGVNEYASELLDQIEEGLDRGWIEAEDLCNRNMIEEALLDGASDWNQYSWGGCSFIWDQDVAKRLCTPSELKRTHNGYGRPNGSEEWLDVQARALFLKESRTRTRKARGLEKGKGGGGALPLRGRS